MAVGVERSVKKTRRLSTRIVSFPDSPSQFLHLILLLLAFEKQIGHVTVDAFPEYGRSSIDLDTNSSNSSTTDDDINCGPHRQTIRIAFLGNSMQYYNDLPRLVGEVFENAGYNFYQENVFRDSANFQTLWDRNDGVRRFWAKFCPWFTAFGSTSIHDMMDCNSGPFDYIVLNDHTQHPARSKSRAESISVLKEEYVPLFVEQDIVPIFYQTFAYREEGAYDSADLGDFQSFTNLLVEGYDEYEAVINAGLIELHSQDPDESPLLEAATAPVGEAFAAIRNSNVELWKDLYTPDGKHPAALGSMLTAYLIYWAIIGEAPPRVFEKRWLVSWKRIREGWDPFNFDLEPPTDEQANEIWEVAGQVYQHHLARKAKLQIPS